MKNKPSKERLGTKPSDFQPKKEEIPGDNSSAHDRLGERRGNFWDRTRPVPGEASPSNQLFIQRHGKMNSEKRKAQRKSSSTRDMASSRQRLPRLAKSYPKPEPEKNQIGGYIFHNREEETTDSEDKYKKSSGS